MLMPRKVRHRKHHRGRLKGTAKPAETRMGSGKGNPERWVAPVKPGRIMFELSYPDEAIARGALERAIQKLPIKARIVTREEGI